MRYKIELRIYYYPPAGNLETIPDGPLVRFGKSARYANKIALMNVLPPTTKHHSKNSLLPFIRRYGLSFFSLFISIITE